MDPDKEGLYQQYLSLAFEYNWDNREDNGKIGIEVKIAFPMSHNSLRIVEEYVQ